MLTLLYVFFPVHKSGGWMTMNLPATASYLPAFGGWRVQISHPGGSSRIHYVLLPSHVLQFFLQDSEMFPGQIYVILPALLPVGRVWNTSTGKRTGGILIRSPDYLNWLLSTQMNSGSTSSSLRLSNLLLFIYLLTFNNFSDVQTKELVDDCLPERLTVVCTFLNDYCVSPLCVNPGFSCQLWVWLFWIAINTSDMVRWHVKLISLFWAYSRPALRVSPATLWQKLILAVLIRNLNLLVITKISGP